VDPYKIEMIHLAMNTKKITMERRMAFMTRRLAESTQDKPLHEHFGVHGKYELRRTNTNTFQLDVHRQVSFVYTFKGIPDEVEKYISSFLHKHFVCVIELAYVEVFRPPTFTTIKLDSNLFINVDGLLKSHSLVYRDSWSPAFTLETDILNLICLIISAIH
jgi:hypothetical protein